MTQPPPRKPGWFPTAGDRPRTVPPTASLYAIRSLSTPTRPPAKATPSFSPVRRGVRPPWPPPWPSPWLQGHLGAFNPKALRRPLALGACALLTLGIVGGFGARSFAAGTSGTGAPPTQGLLPTTVSLPPISLSPLPAPLPAVPPVDVPPVTLPALPPLIGSASSAVASAGRGAYRGLGAWVDLYHYGVAGSPPPASVVAEMAGRGVRTIYIETARWTSAGDLDHPAELGAFLDAAHARGLKVVGWYLPGFADTGTDVRRSLAVLTFTSPGGQHFDGFAADIEDRSATATQDQFNAGIATYAKALRSAVAPGTTLGAIVPDAKNDERAPAHWAGFPWPQIGDSFDVVLPMAYWSVTKYQSTCLATQMDVTSYINEVIDETDALMGQSKPIAPMGGISNCDTQQEVAEYVSTLRARGAIGGGLYDFELLEARPDAGTIWGELSGLNG
jgi:hypothetical protein